MANASRDENRVTSRLGVLNLTGLTIVPITADASSHGLSVDDDTTGSNLGPTNADRDENHVTSLIALSSDDDGVLVPLYATSDGALLIDSN